MNRQHLFNSEIVKGYIFIPSDQFGDARGKFIQKCYRKKSVSVLLPNGGFTHNCPIDLLCLKEIEFPEEKNQVGSTVLCYYDRLSGKPMVFSVFGKEDDIVLQGEGDRQILSIDGNKHAKVLSKGSSGEVFISAYSDESDGGNIILTLNNSNRSSQLKIRVLGDINMYGENSVTISSKTIVKLFGGGQPVVLGDTLKTELEKLSGRVDTIENAIQNSPVVASDGGASFKSGMISILNQNQQKESFNNINSEKVFTD